MRVKPQRRKNKKSVDKQDKIATILSMIMSANITVTNVTVTQTNIMTNEVIVIDNDGEEWSFYGDDYKINENITVVFDEDEIIDVVE